MAGAMDGRVAIVTGGGRGIGASTVRALAARGACVVVNYSRSREEAEALAADCGGEAIAVGGDLAEDGACSALAAAALDRFGRIDMLVNNAGKTKFANHEDLDALDAEDWIDLYRLNVIGAWQTIRACAPAMRKAGRGSVVNVASVAGVFGHGSSVAYAASKGAMITMTKSLARALAPAIRVNAIAPGYVGTGWFGDRFGADTLARMNAQAAAGAPLGVATGPDDIADTIVTLLDDATRLVTGEVLLVDAGAHLDVGGSRRPGRDLR